MIADNYATPRDMKLMKSVSKPVKVILCGTRNGINTAYLDFVRANRGSLHTMDADLYELAKMNEGQTVTIGGIEYKLSGGVFHKISRL